MEINVRPYKSSDYDALIELYKNKELYGGEFSEYRDSKTVIEKIIEKDPFSVIVAEADKEIVGTVSLIENERVAWLYRFCVIDSENNDEISNSLFERAESILKKRGHLQVLVYSAPNNRSLDSRYLKLGFIKGGTYACFWKNID